ncbi:hypothetical protein PENFLA_c031G10762 [Penicillium flavigenum]|uniref:Uncharacterized protein n=1 Tax=Penicillium flavigenum TaxID=254877 RepID=A0A1V6SNH1_9EURO|nr:hypothetical protein PENFLA_c031G10762 [Penicillium flavigenum]
MSSEKARRKRPAVSPAPGSPGPSKKKTQDNTSDSERRTAADTDTASLRKIPKAARQTKETSFKPFAISWVCFAAERHFREPAKEMRKNVPFMLLSKPVNRAKFAKVTTAPETLWPYKETDQDARKSMQKQWIVAWCLYKMASDVNVYNANTAEENERRTKSEQAKFLERHAAEFAKLNLTFPSETVGFPFPHLGPLKDTKEGELEVFNRCWEVLQCLASGLFKSTWEKQFGSSKVVNNGTTVNQSNFPPWMRTTSKKAHSGLGTIDSTFETDNLPPINVRLRWIRGPKVLRHEETEEAIEDAESRGIAVPSTEQLLPGDPRLCISGYHFRDKIRRSMGCRDLGH